MDSQVNFPNSQVNNKPYIGMKFGSENEAYDYYNSYGGTAGFGIRRECVHKDKNDKSIIRSRRFLCNKAGSRGFDKRDKCTKKPRPETRTECLAKMCISRLPNGEYICREFVDDHNHELHTPDTRHFIRSQCNITDLQGFESDKADDAGIRPKAAYDYMSIQEGGTQNIGYTRTNLKNYLCTKRQDSLEYGEASILSDYFAAHPLFTHRLQYDREENVTNIFWTDPRMLIDYALFGDVVEFDTTFSTNKENRPFVVFSGFNHHGGTTIFGAGLLYDKTIDSFKWLFETFLEVHRHKKPKSIFTDEDIAMGNAIIEVMPETMHGLSAWHIKQSGKKNLAYLIKEDKSIWKEFKRCMYEIEDEIEFEEAWKQMHIEYQIENNSWLDQMYGLKKKWANCYMNKIFTAGVTSIDISESIISDLKDYLKRSLNLKQFFTHFERVLANKRLNEFKAEFDARNTTPDMMGLVSPVLRQAGKVYTPYIYSEFQLQYRWIASCFTKRHDDTPQVVHYTISVVDEDGDMLEQEFEVEFMPSGPFVACSCKLFETFGILCTHALKILDVMNIKQIPEIYIMPRWTRAVRSTIVEDTKRVQVNENANLDLTQGFQITCSQFVNLLAQASTSIAGMRLAQDIAHTFRIQLAAFQIDSPPTAASVQNGPYNTDLVPEKERKAKRRYDD